MADGKVFLMSSLFGLSHTYIFLTFHSRNYLHLKTIPGVESVESASVLLACTIFVAFSSVTQRWNNFFIGKNGCCVTLAELLPI